MPEPNPSSIAAVPSSSASQRIVDVQHYYAAQQLPPALPPFELTFPQTAGVYGALHQDALTHNWMDDNGRTMRSIAAATHKTPLQVNQKRAMVPTTYQAGNFKGYYGQDPEVVAKRAQAIGMGRGAPWYDVGSTHEYSLYQKGAFDRKGLGCILIGAGIVGGLVGLAWMSMAQKTTKRK